LDYDSIEVRERMEDDFLGLESEPFARMTLSDEEEVDDQGNRIIVHVGDLVEKNSANGRPPRKGVVTELRPVPGEPDLVDVYVRWTPEN
jgi:hypothetical protein